MVPNEEKTDPSALSVPRPLWRTFAILINGPEMTPCMLKSMNLVGRTKTERNVSVITGSPHTGIAEGGSRPLAGDAGDRAPHCPHGGRDTAADLLRATPGSTEWAHCGLAAPATVRTPTRRADDSRTSLPLPKSQPAKGLPIHFVFHKARNQA